MPLFEVTWVDAIEAADNEAAAVEAARRLLTNAPQIFRTKIDRGQTILIRVDRGEGKRI